MKTVKNAGRAASGNKAPKSDDPASLVTSVRVCVSTFEKIAMLSDEHLQPPALIAGALAEIGVSLLDEPPAATLANTTHDQLLMRVIRKQFAKPRVATPFLCSQDTWTSSVSWAKDFNRPMAEWLAHMVELGLAHYKGPGLLKRLLPSEEEAYFLSLGHRIRVDVPVHEPAFAGLLKQPSSGPSAFEKFEKALAVAGPE